MGHATHFLQRIERLSSPQADFALELYRNSALVRFILEKSRLPDGAERVALSLSEQPDGPHIVVTREGAFVTCLGAGMSTKDLPVITRGRIERLGSRYEAMHEAMARIRDHRETHRLIGNLFDKGNTLSREDFSALAALMPITEDWCVGSLAETLPALVTFREHYSRTRYRGLNDKQTERLKYYCSVLWATSHLLALCGTRGPELGVKHSATHGWNYIYGLCCTGIYTLHLPVMLRAAWAAGRVGRDVVPEAKHKVRGAQGFIELIVNALPLTAVGLRHRSARAEVQKIITRTRRALEDTMSKPSNREVADPVLHRLELAFEPEGEAHSSQAHREIGASMAYQLGQRLPEGHALRHASPEEVPEDLARTLPMYLSEDYHINLRLFLSVLTATMPWLASADAADLYLPAHVLEAYGDRWNRWTPKMILAHLDAVHHSFQRDKPARAEKKPGRNDPCPCGSGQKYKRCCGA